MGGQVSLQGKSEQPGRPMPKQGRHGKLRADSGKLLPLGSFCPVGPTAKVSLGLMLVKGQQ